jgi:thioredoxin 1
MKPAETNNATFESDIQEKGVTIVDFWAEWCGPCHMIAPILEEMGEERPELKILKVDVDKNSALAEDFGIQSIPTLLIFKNKELVDRVVGAMHKTALLMEISKHFEV